MSEALRRTGIAGNPGEYFNPYLDTGKFRSEFLGIKADAEYLQGVINASTTQNGVFGTKIHFGQIPLFLSRIRAEGRVFGTSPFSVFAARFPNLRYIWLRRKNEVRQAISLYRASMTNVWWKFAKETPRLYEYKPIEKPGRDRDFDFDGINRCLSDIRINTARWSEFFDRSGGIPFRLTYEDLDKEYGGTVVRVLNFLGLPVPATIPPKNMERQADGRTDAWEKKFLQYLRRSRG